MLIENTGVTMFVNDWEKGPKTGRGEAVGGKERGRKREQMSEQSCSGAVGVKENATNNEMSILPTSSVSHTATPVFLWPPLSVHLNPGITMSSQRLRSAWALIVCI